MFLLQIDLPSLELFKSGFKSFFNTSSLILSSKVIIECIIQDLPRLTTIITRKYSFHMLSSLSLESK